MAFLDLTGLTRFKNKLSGYFFSPEYDSTATYTVGDYCSYEGKPYKCTTAISTAEAWNSSHWTSVKLLGEISNKANKTDTVLDTTLSRGRKANTTVGTGSFAFGQNVTASGVYSHAEGYGNASGSYSHAEGNSNASGNYSHAEGNSKASGTYSHAEGDSTTATGMSSHSEGGGTIAAGADAHAEGYHTYARGERSHAEGYNTIAFTENQHVSGEYNLPIYAAVSNPGYWSSSTSYEVGNLVSYQNNPYVCIKAHSSSSSFPTDKFAKCERLSTGDPPSEIIGCGTSNTARKNIRVLSLDGNEHLAGNLYVQASSDNCLDGTRVATIDEIVKPFVVTLDQVTNTSGSYTHTTSITGVNANMKPIQIQVSNPKAFQDEIQIDTATDTVTLTCSSVSGTSDVYVTLMVQHPDISGMTASEYDVLLDKIGDLTALTTSTRSSLVGATNELNSNLSNLLYYKDFTYSAPSYSGATIGDVINTISTYKSIAVTGYTPVAISLTDYPSALYNVTVFITPSNSRAYIRAYAASTNGSAEDIKYRVLYIKS